jgi:hypothetical protein
VLGVGIRSQGCFGCRFVDLHNHQSRLTDPS